jgi:Delta3-Delta2-enoyl-CoA isomerase
VEEVWRLTNFFRVWSATLTLRLLQVVGLLLPPVILAALRRLVGPRHAERLAGRGLLISSAEATACGLVNELAPVDQVVDRALKWCEGLLALPRTAMETTRRQVRADLVAEFGRETARELAEVIRWRWSEETQTRSIEWSNSP